MMDLQEMIQIDTNMMPWKEQYQEALSKAMFVKMLLQDPDTGMMIRMVRYPAGFWNKWHDHPCAHGMFVLEGTLVTHTGEHGPGSFVWFPEGMQMEHGATVDKEVVALFITNKPFSIRYVEKKV
jgi:quercetin dioxygenase-like cupin family protein